MFKGNKEGSFFQEKLQIEVIFWINAKVLIRKEVDNLKLDENIKKTIYKILRIA